MFQYCRKLRESKVSGDLTTTVRKGDARDLGFSADHFDAAITSPPYGEEKNTIGYTRWSKLSMAWLRLNSHVLNESERMSLGGVTSENALRRLNDLRSPTAAGILREISKTDRPRVNDALPFFFDYGKTMKEIHRVLKREAYYCIVIGDRSIRKKLVDMERVTVELGTAAGFTHVKSYFRTIPMKLIPWTTPTGKTISRESIIILQKK
jgi:site-specific DNA-methyltransferase (cytosine-N4-specific)